MGNPISTPKYQLPGGVIHSTKKKLGVACCEVNVIWSFENCPNTPDSFSFKMENSHMGIYNHNIEV